jgi:transcription initiation factor TFIID subunit 7
VSLRSLPSLPTDRHQASHLLKLLDHHISRLEAPPEEHSYESWCCPRRRPPSLWPSPPTTMAADNAKPTLKLETSQFNSQAMPPPPTSAATPSANPRPILKLNTSSRQSSFSADAQTPSTERKIKIKVNPSQPSTSATAVSATPAASTPTVTKTKAGRSSKPTEKIIEAKKRQFSEVDNEDDDENTPMASRKVQKTQKMKIKMRTSQTDLPRKAFGVQTPTSNRLLLKAKGERVDHEPGEAWDSEASDREDDPVREAAMILRTLPGTSTEYLNKAIEDGRIGHPKPPNGNGADLSIDWLDAKERRAMVTIDGHHYAAVLVDLPTVVEAMKTWDRKNFLKNMDITQMLLCFAPVATEQEAKTIGLPPMVQQAEHKWPHGLTPPMHDAINRRFRKQPSEKQLISAAAQVKKLLADDLAAVEPPTYEFIQDDEDGYFDSGDEDAEGEEETEEDYFANAGGASSEPIREVDLNAGLEAELEAELAGDLFGEEMDGATPGTQLEAQTPMTLDATTPAAVADEDQDEDDEDEEEDVSDEDEDDEEDDDELDEEEAAKQAELREIRSELLELQRKVTNFESQLASQTNALMRNRMQNNIQNLKKEIQLRKAKLNITDD